MSFNVDDPLAGILSDGSDDSFFDDDILGKKKPAKKKTTPVAEKKNALFDLESNEKSKVVGSTLDNKKDSLFNLGSTDPLKSESSKSPGPAKKITSTTAMNDLGKSPARTKQTASADKLDILAELGTEPKKDTGKTIERGKSSQSILDDILGGPTTKTGGPTQSIRPATAAKNSDFDFDSFLSKNESKAALSSNKNVPQIQTTRPEKPKGNADQAKKSKTSQDWLGIFQDNEEVDNTGEDAGMPAWLVGGDTKKKKSATEKKISTTEVVTKEVPKEKEELVESVEKEKEYKPESILEQMMKMTQSTNVLHGSNEDVTTEGATLYLQQQESQLMVALQLKAQEEKLAAMQMRQQETQRVQREAALAHHAQLDAMLRRQADQRQQMQAIIASHQERITQRIKALLGATNVDQNGDANVSGPDEFENNTEDRKDSPYTKEKKQLLQLVQSLQENHDKEIDLMETSFRRQIAFVEISLNQAEERMKEESDKLVKFYTEKINWLEEHHTLFKKLTEDNLIALTERHKAENEMLRNQHLDNIKVLQEHHATLMENIKNAVKQEQVFIQDSVGFSANLNELIANIKDYKSQCHELVDKVQTLGNNTTRDTDRSIQVRETQINDMIQQLKNEREQFENEKTESREIVKMLEARLKQMTMMMEEESVALKQKRMEFEFEKATFNKQTEFAKNVLKKQDEEIKMLKEDIQREYQEKIGKINEEKAKAVKDSAAVAKERASVQSLKQELEKMKAELQAQLEEVTEERSKLSVEKQQLQMEEQRILAKSRDLDLLAKSAIEKQSQADKKYSEAEFIQRKYEERIRRIQEHVVSLNSREKQIAKEKVALSRERLNLHNERKQMESRQPCSLCRSAQNAPQYNFDPNYGLPDNFLNVPVSRDYGGGNVSSAMSAIEQEMANLMSRNFSLRHSTSMHVSSNDGRFGTDHDRQDVEDTMQPTHIDSGAFKDYMDPKFMMLRLDVQQVLSNLDNSKRDEVDREPLEEE